MTAPDGHACPAGSPDCGYVGGGDSDEDRRADWEHMYWEHRPCTECPAVPRDGDSLTHSSSCPRLKPDYAYPPVELEPGDPIPPERTGGLLGFVAGECGHRVAGSEWRAGFRNCERCPS